jgi:hypothetical protein
MSHPPQYCPRKAALSQKPARTNGEHAGIVGNLVFLLMAVAVVSVWAAVTAACSGLSTSAVAGASGGSTSVSQAQASGDVWIPLRSQAPADIIAAARQSALFREPRSDAGDHVRDLSRLGSPVLVRALRPAGVSADQVPDFYVVPILNASGTTTDAAELALNPSHSAVQVIAIVTYTTPRAHAAVAWLAPNDAGRAVANLRHAAMPAGAQPYLVYFPMDPLAPTDQTGQPAWKAGGALPADPLWLVPAADGQAFLAGNDGQTYTISQLPLWNGH